MKMAPSRMEGHSNRDNDMLEGETALDERSNNTSLFIVILSLVFVAIFGCALVGGVISGDPTNGFFITIIVASALAISVTIVVSIRYICTKSARNNSSEQYLSKENRGTLSSDDEENQYEEEYVNRPPLNQTQSEIKEIQAKSVFGEMSALSPQSYDEDSLSTFRHHIIQDHGRQGFDFSRITSGEDTEKVKTRQDPPEGVGLATIQAAWITRGSSQDPSAPKFSTDGKIIGDEGQPDSNQFDSDSQMNSSFRDNKSDDGNKNDADDDEVNTVTTVNKRRSRSRSPSKSSSPSPSRCTKSPSNSVANSLSSKRNKKGQKFDALNPPSSTKSGPISMLASSMPPTPAASETGSLASSLFSIFGKSKKSSSEAGASNVNSSNISDTLESSVRKVKASVGKTNKGRPPMVRPPMMPSLNRKGDEMTKIIDGRFGPPPSTPGNKSTFTIPPPRPIPRTPMGSEVFSEFQSVVGSAAASSTFDPEAHQRALEKMRKNHASIGASPVDVNSMPIYYNEDNENDKESSVTPSSVVESSSLSYDVFAPPGALGIVVDTTEKGCIVYSLKKSSPMQGLMSRGDLIIGLDNFDVKNLSAASLTKLMAKKSEQAERKFTLVPDDS